VIAEDDRPIGAPVLPERRRDRFSVYVAEHGWAVPVIRVAAGLCLASIVWLVFDSDWALDKLLAFVVGSGLGHIFGESEAERGETLGGGGPESLPAEFAEHFHTPPDPRYDGRYVRPQ
jgi:hypothetical protein